MVRIEVDPRLSVREIQARFHVSRVSAWRARKRAWLVIKRKEVAWDAASVAALSSQVEQIRSIAASEFRRLVAMDAFLCPAPVADEEDFVQEAVARVYELAEQVLAVRDLFARRAFIRRVARHAMLCMADRLRLRRAAVVFVPMEVSHDENT